MLTVNEYKIDMRFLEQFLPRASARFGWYYLN